MNTSCDYAISSSYSIVTTEICTNILYVHITFNHLNTYITLMQFELCGEVFTRLAYLKYISIIFTQFYTFVIKKLKIPMFAELNNYVVRNCSSSSGEKRAKPI